MLQTLLQLFHGNIIIVIMLFSFWWLFLEIKKNFERLNDTLITNYKMVLDVLSPTKIQLDLFLRKQDDDTKKQFYDSLSKSLPYLSKDLVNIYNEFVKAEDTDILKKFKEKLDNFIDEQKKRYDQSLFAVLSGTSIGSMDYYFLVIQKITSPFYFTLILFLVVIGFLSIVLDIQSMNSIEQKLRIGIVTMDIILLFAIGSAGLSLYFRYLVKKIKFHWGRLLIIFMCPLLSLLFSFSFKNLILNSVPLLLFIILMIVLLIKEFKKDLAAGLFD